MWRVQGVLSTMRRVPAACTVLCGFLRSLSAACLFESLRADADKGADEVLAEELAPVRLRLALVHIWNRDMEETAPRGYKCT